MTGTVTDTAHADAWSDQASANNNVGADSPLKVQGKSNNNFRALVKFNLPTSIPAGCVVQCLYVPSFTAGRTLQVLRINAT